MQDVIMDSGEKVGVRRLTIFELDDAVKTRPLGPYTVTIKINDKHLEVPHDASRYDEPPREMDSPDSYDEGTEEWHAAREYWHYMAWVQHEQRRMESIHAYMKAVSDYIMNNCVSPEDAKKIVSADDWDAVRRAALVPQLTQEDLERVLRDGFRSRV